MGISIATLMWRHPGGVGIGIDRLVMLMAEPNGSRRYPPAMRRLPDEQLGTLNHLGPVAPTGKHCIR